MSAEVKFFFFCLDFAVLDLPDLADFALDLATGQLYPMKHPPTCYLKVMWAKLFIGLWAIAGPPAHFPAMPIPADNPMSPSKIALGKKLFYDPRLSSDNTVSCASCHKPQFAFSDTTALSSGVEGRKGSRNAPSLTNVGYRDKLFWEGGSPRLELQAIGPLTAHDEMNMEPAALVAKLKKLGYQPSFAIFSGGLTMLNITKALAAFLLAPLGTNTARAIPPPFQNQP
jgi:cytochrome c peroxidase